MKATESIDFCQDENKFNTVLPTSSLERVNTIQQYFTQEIKTPLQIKEKATNIDEGAQNSATSEGYKMEEQIKNLLSTNKD